jgi:hypothetical protein
MVVPLLIELLLYMALHRHVLAERECTAAKQQLSNRCEIPMTFPLP